MGKISRFLVTSIMLGALAFPCYSLPKKELAKPRGDICSYLEHGLSAKLGKDIPKPKSRLIEEALKALERTEKIESQPEYSKYVEIGEDLITVGEYELAIKLYEKSIELYKKVASNTYNMGVCYFYLENYQKAYDWFTETLKISETSQYYFARGLASHMMEKYKDAINDYEWALKFDCSYQLESDTLNNLAWALYSYGESLEEKSVWAMPLYERALRCIERIQEIEKKIGNTPSHLAGSEKIIVYHGSLKTLKEILEKKIQEHNEKIY